MAKKKESQSKHEFKQEFDKITKLPIYHSTFRLSKDKIIEQLFYQLFRNEKLERENKSLKFLVSCAEIQARQSKRSRGRPKRISGDLSALFGNSPKKRRGAPEKYSFIYARKTLRIWDENRKFYAENLGKKSVTDREAINYGVNNDSSIPSTKKKEFKDALYSLIKQCRDKTGIRIYKRVHEIAEN